MTLEELVRYAWNSGMGSYHDTKTSKQLENELNDFIDEIEDDLKLFVAVDNEEKPLDKDA